ncbi:hypothetical protein MTR67_052335 [Solanum verrucosum]|uniref:Late blight resistance protein n=1 Tax=Solanum verrucosum TaxID=315347 RepID=A0AAF0V6S0_SOLVR|nr:hypothetical protein MTR67_052335 [Solanum verrucosum]
MRCHKPKTGPSHPSRRPRWVVKGPTRHGQTTARAGGPWFTTATPPQTSSEKLAKSRLTDRPTVRRSDHGPWSVSVDRDFPYQPLTQTTVDQHGPSIDPRSVGLTVDEDQQPVS